MINATGGNGAFERYVAERRVSTESNHALMGDVVQYRIMSMRHYSIERDSIYEQE